METQNTTSEPSNARTRQPMLVRDFLHRVVDSEPSGRHDELVGVVEAAGDLQVPTGYWLTPTHTQQGKVIRMPSALDMQSQTEVNVMYVNVASAPILILSRLVNLETNEEYLRLAWLRNGWRTCVESRATLMNARDLVKLAGRGFPVTSGSSGDVSRYLDAFERANLDRLPLERVSHHLGWQGEHGHYGFLWGQTHFPASQVTGTAGDRSDHVAFRGPSSGDDQLAKGFHAKGNVDAWLKGLAPIQDHPKALLGFYAAFVPPLLDILGCPNFIIDWGSQTSTGKTTLLRIAASVVGNPNEDASDTVLGSWDTTRVAVERHCALLTGLPVLLDDTRKAKKPEVVGEVLYVAASGQGRSRGNLEGQDQTHSWRTVLLSTGEGAAVSFTQAGGTRGRVLTIRGLPFGSAKAHALVQALNKAVTSHYGHGLPLFIPAILERRDFWPYWQRAYEDERARLADQATNNVGVRIAAYAAAVNVTAKLVHRVFAEAGHPLPWRYSDHRLETLWRTLLAETDEAAVDLRALEDVKSWAQANDGRFYSKDENSASSGYTSLSSFEPFEPAGGWFGRKLDDQRVAFFPPKLREYLEHEGYRYEEVTSGWRERGWLEVDKEGKMKQVSWPPTKSKARMVVLRPAAWAHGEPSESTESSEHGAAEDGDTSGDAESERSTGNRDTGHCDNGTAESKTTGEDDPWSGGEAESDTESWLYSDPDDGDDFCPF